MSILVSVMFGLGAGIVGMLLVAAYLIPTPVTIDSAATVKQLWQSREPDSPIVLPTSVENAERSIASFFVKKAATGSLVSRSYLDGDLVAAGMVLTSDGWIISHTSSFPRLFASQLEGYVAVIGKSAHDLTQIIEDPFTGIVLVKADATNLPVTAFDGAEQLTAGDAVYGFDRSGGIRKLEVASFGNLPVATASDLIRSSEQLQKVLRFAVCDDDLPTGSMLVNGKGEAVGVFVSEPEAGSYAVPLTAFSTRIGDFLRESRAVRPYLGVHYVDMAELVGVGGGGEQLRGALLMDSADGMKRAVTRNSPAQDADLESGDLIVAINGEEVTVNKGLSDIIAEYKSGDTLMFSVRKGYDEAMDDKAEIELVEVTLGTLP